MWDISSFIKDAYIITGDFNAIIDIEDRIGGAPVRMSDIHHIKTCMRASNMSTHKIVGRHYTWNNKQ